MKDGYFLNHEYILTNMRPRRHMFNYLWNNSMLCQCDHFGFGYSFINVDNQRRDIENGERNVYIKDKNSGEIYSANRNYHNLPFDKHECHVGLGYQQIISEYKGLHVEFTILVAKDDPVLLFNIKVQNISNAKKEFDLYFTNYPKPDISWHNAYGSADYDKSINGLMYCHDGFRLPNKYVRLFVASDLPFDAFETSKPRFIGTYSNAANPEALKEDKLSSKGVTFEEYIAAFQYSLSLEAGEKYEINLCAAAATNNEECCLIAKKYLATGQFAKEMQKQIELNNSYIDVFKLNSPDEYLNNQVNIWLKRQLSLGKTWGRIYGKGFRDVMQDITAFVSFDNALAKQKILGALKYQYEDGNPIRMFEPNFKYPYNDGAVWIPATVLAYINESGDKDILNIDLPYLVGNSLQNSNLSDAFVYEPYVAGQRKGNVFEHIKAGIDYLLNSRGQHGLVLWRGGDWNDSLNNAGNKGIGESVWLTIAAVKAINDFLEILKIAEHLDEVSQYEKAREELKNSIDKYGRYDNHFIYGINDEQEIIGGEERIFLNPQSWAVLGNASSKEKLNQAMDVVEKDLKCDFGYVLCSPSYTKGQESIGRVSFFKPGLVENGGVYNHGVAFKIIADCMLDRNDIAYQTLKLISCDNPRLANSGVEPYAVTNMYIGPENPYLAGFAPMSWVTGTAGWLYRAVTEYICGIQATETGLKIKPHLPSCWDEIEVSRLFRGANYQIKIKRDNNKGIFVNNKKIEGDTIINPKNEKEILCEVHI